MNKALPNKTYKKLRSKSKQITKKLNKGSRIKMRIKISLYRATRESYRAKEIKNLTCRINLVMETN